MAPRPNQDMNVSVVLRNESYQLLLGNNLALYVYPRRGGREDTRERGGCCKSDIQAPCVASEWAICVQNQHATTHSPSLSFKEGS